MKDISQIVPDAAAFDAALVSGLQRAVGHTVIVTTQKARSEHRWQDRTGNTRANIDGAVDNVSDGAHGVVGADDIAQLLNDGTRPHEIRGKRGGYLKFEVGGATIFRRSVRHPGTSPDPFLDAAADAAEEELDRGADAAIDAALGE